MTVAALSASLPPLLPWLVLGAALGAAYFRLLARGVAALVPGGRPARAAGYLALRTGLAVAALVWAAGHGALPLLAVLAGFLAARTLVLRRAREG